MKPKRIVIVGLGLIGGSLARASRKAFPRARIVGVTRSRAALAKAKKKGWIHEGFTDLKRAFERTAPLVVLCTPVDTLKNFLIRLDSVAPKGTIVTDAGSVKGFLVRWADRKRWRRIEFVGAHPMAGSHERGIEHARSDLFQRALTFVTPGKSHSAYVFRTVLGFWKQLSRRVVVISAEKHDEVTSHISHLPHLAASALVAGVPAKDLSFAASGFLDTTRVAASDPDLWVPIFLENRGPLFRSLRHFEARLDALSKILKRGDRGRLRTFLRASQRRRVSL